MSCISLDHYFRLGKDGLRLDQETFAEFGRLFAHYFDHFQQECSHRVLATSERPLLVSIEFGQDIELPFHHLQELITGLNDDQLFDTLPALQTTLTLKSQFNLSKCADIYFAVALEVIPEEGYCLLANRRVIQGCSGVSFYSKAFSNSVPNTIPIYITLGGQRSDQASY